MKTIIWAVCACVLLAGCSTTELDGTEDDRWETSVTDRYFDPDADTAR
jgi:hypothetical protein